MRGFLSRSTIAFLALLLIDSAVRAQVADQSDQTSVRVTMTVNADGSRTTYRFDTGQKKASAVTTTPDGKIRERIEYDLDDNGRFADGVISDASGKFLFKSLYKYDAARHLAEETHLRKDGAIINKLVYQYDAAGKQIGYSVFDATGKFAGKTTASSPTTTPKSR